MPATESAVIAARSDAAGPAPTVPGPGGSPDGRSGAGGSGRASAGLLAISVALAGLLNYAFALALSYELTPADYVVFVGAQSLIVINGVVGSVGVPFVLAQEIRAARLTGDAERRRRAVTFGFWTNAALGVVSALIVGVLVARFGSLLDAALIAITVVALAVGSTGFGVLQGNLQNAKLSVVTVLEVVVKFGLGVGLVIGVDRRPYLALVGVAAGAMVLLVTLRYFARDIGRPTGLRRFTGLLKSAVQIGSVQVAVGVLAAVDVYVAASAHLPSVEAANYQVAAALGKSAVFIAAAVSLAVFPLLGGPDEEEHRQAALTTYVIAGGFVAVALVTAPPALVADVLSTDYTTVSHWLLFTSALGFALGLSNVVSTFVQSRYRPSDTPGWNGTVLSAVVLAATIGVIVWAARQYGTTGLAVAGVGSAWGSVLVFSGFAPERRTWRLFLRGIVRPGTRPHGRLGVASAVVAVAALVTLRYVSPVLWFAAAVPLGLVALFCAFPEFRPRRRGSGGRHRGAGDRSGPVVAAPLLDVAILGGDPSEPTAEDLHH